MELAREDGLCLRERHPVDDDPAGIGRQDSRLAGRHQPHTLLVCPAQERFQLFGLPDVVDHQKRAWPPGQETTEVIPRPAGVLPRFESVEIGRAHV